MVEGVLKRFAEDKIWTQNLAHKEKTKKVHF